MPLYAGQDANAGVRILSVLKSHFNPTCIVVYKQLCRLCEQRFVRTFDLQKGFSLSEAVNDSDGSGKEMVCQGSEDLKSVGAPLPLEQKHTVWIRTGNLQLIKRTALTTEPRMQI